MPLLVFAGFLVVQACRDQENPPSSGVHSTGFLNLHDSVRYVGMSTCRQCHSNIHETFQHTGMGLSFDRAIPAKSSASFSGHSPVYDSRFDYYYYPYWSGEKLMLREFRLAGKDTIHKREQRIDYIIGSGQHTNSHLYEVNGFVFQAPVTWYSQEKKWGLPPGFDEGAVTRFSRIISLECMSCHNAYPDFVARSENRFRKVLQGIDCERCHGPGSLHVQEKMAGKIVDTSRLTDYTIVNPKKLPADLQMEICQRCHLQGNAVLKPGKSFFDFRPGMKLTEVFDVFMPVYKGDQRDFIMASHVERLKMSKCYQAGANSFNCISCHNPHVSVRVTGKQAFNQSCATCHKTDACTDTPTNRKREEDNCVACHMPASGPVDIPHVTTHDHYIRKPRKRGTPVDAKTFAGLTCLTDSNPGPLTRARAYLNYFEKFDSRKEHLDSARYWLEKSPPGNLQLITRVHDAYLRQDFQALRNMHGSLATCDSCLGDAWTCYRMGEAYQQVDSTDKAQLWYIFAVKAMPHSPEFRNKLGATYLAQKRYAEAALWFQHILKDLPQFVPAANNLGFTRIQQNRLAEAIPLFERALNLDPDYVLARKNLVIALGASGQKSKAREIALQLMKDFPGNSEYHSLYRSTF